MRRELVTVASHELKTPLTTLRMALGMLRESAAALTARQQELLVTAFDGIDQLGATVDEFLDFTRIEAGQLRLSWERVDVAALAAQVADSFRPHCEDTRVRLELMLAPSLPSVRGDAARLRSVLSNLLTNAIKYTPAQGTICLQATEHPEERTVTLAVTDTGRGIAAEYRERIFDKFFRVEHERVEPDEGVRGTGIGLYLAREIAEAHGGTLRCTEPLDGRGARFVLTLPATA
jgi:NtrC-family two-component system sensor histidine kinase KinB